ncbi:hypothetical protein [Tuwongella immobilis]|uniref:Uncharacterized protein n=1 Tax=Tuwongella immobilis TaxID=692036 RepID=A0A6C2YHY1_9BACT|nr:hypothetical protein [Tuwongella immobilis]VIP01026.1 unnamed protein product [Tuwongella immobilis]VTR97477.1 unnamed protein product [Tuwongella immobilis]
METAELVQKLWKVARQHDRGIICPSVMWEEIAHLLKQTNIDDLLQLTSPECQAVLRRSYQDRPESLHHAKRDQESQQVVDAIEAWCQKEASESVSSHVVPMLTLSAQLSRNSRNA